MACFFGPWCDFSLEASSPPFAIFRNKEGHQIDTKFNKKVYNNYSKKQYDLHSWYNNIYYKKNQQDYPIPSELLCDTVLEDTLLRNDERIEACNHCGKNSVLGFHHEEHSLFVHTAGKCFDQLVLRYADDIQPGLIDSPNVNMAQQSSSGIEVKKKSGNSSGFVLPLGGLRIEQVKAWGTGQFNTSSNLMVRSAHAVYHVRTLNVQDSLARIPPGFEEPQIPHFWSKRSIILDPVQKWQMSYGTLRDMSGSKNIYSQNLLLLENNVEAGKPPTMELLTACPHSGIRGVLSKGCSIFPQSVGVDNIKSEVTVESLLHPNLCLLSHSSSIFVKDTREPSTSHQLMKAPLAVTSVLSIQETNSVSQSSHSSSSNYIMVGQPDEILLMDLRCMRRIVAQRPVPGGTHYMCSAGLHAYSSSVESRADGMERQVILSGGAKGRQLFSHHMHVGPANGTDTHDSSKNEPHFLLMNEEFGCRTGGVSWETAGWPIIDRILPTSKLMGIGLLSTSKCVLKSTSSTDSCFVTEDNEANLESRGIVIQQSGTGDVYAQHVTLVLLDSDDGTVVDALDEDDLATASQQRVADRKRQNLKQKAPIQKHLPVGIRCPAFPSSHVEEAVHIKEEDQKAKDKGIAAAIRKRAELQESGVRCAGFGLRGILLGEDSKLNLYPLGEANIVPNLEEREKKKSCTMMLDLEEIHIKPDHNMRSDATVKVQKIPFKIEDKSRLIRMLLDKQETLMSALARNFFTLYELWEWFVKETGYDCDIELLRQSMLDLTTKSKYSNVDAKSPALPFSSVKVSVTAPPPSFLRGSADGLEMKLLDENCGGMQENSVGYQDLCSCHDAIEKYLQQQCPPLSHNSSSSDEEISMRQISTCARPTCLVFHCYTYKIGFMDWPDPAEPMRVPPSHINPKYVAKESAKRRRLEEVEAAQQQSHVQVSDVTLELIEQLRNEWDGD